MSRLLEELNMSPFPNIEKGKRIYEKIAGEVESFYPPHSIIAINTKTEEYAVFGDGLEALKLADERFPKGERYLRRVGEPSSLYGFGG